MTQLYHHALINAVSTVHNVVRVNDLVAVHGVGLAFNTQAPVSYTHLFDPELNERPLPEFLTILLCRGKTDVLLTLGAQNKFQAQLSGGQQ